MTFEIIFLNNTQIVLEKLVAEPFLKNLWIVSLKFYTVCFYCMIKLRTTKKNKKRPRISVSASFPAYFSRKISFILYSINLPNFTD